MSEAKDLYISDGQYLAALENLRKGIESGVPLKAIDDTTPGDKSTTCSWGLCSEERRVWPDKAMQLFPDHFPQRIAPKYRGKHHKCPMDRRTPEEAEKGLGYGSGCFYHCRIFQAKPQKGQPIPSKEVALELFAQTNLEHAKNQK